MSLVVCPTPGWSGASCKKRVCPVCGPRWAQNWHRVMFENLEHYGGTVVMIAITPPGAEQLPWDDYVCRHKGRPGHPHKHSGKRGCRVQQRVARMWTETVTWRWAKMRNAAQLHTKRRTGCQANLLERVWEMQRRGVPHLHLVLGYTTLDEIRAAKEFVQKLHQLAPEYGFGFVDRKLRPMSPKEAARYCASYLTGRSKHKPSIRDAAKDPAWSYMGNIRAKYSLPLVYMSVRLTRETFVTMRALRRARHLWAATKGFCDPPKWTGMVEGMKVGSVFLRCYLKRAGPEITTEELDWAKGIDDSLHFFHRAAWGDEGLRYVMHRAQEIAATVELVAA